MSGTVPILPDVKGVQKRKLPEQPKVCTDGWTGDLIAVSPTLDPGPVEGGSEVILLVDDEKEVREVGGRVLRKYGYTVFPAANGEDALDVWKEHRSSISMLVTDMVMPGELSGWELAQQLLDVQPMLRVIFTSGYTAEAAKKVFEISDEIILIQKPYAPESLAAAVRKALDFS